MKINLEIPVDWFEKHKADFIKTGNEDLVECETTINTTEGEREDIRRELKKNDEGWDKTYKFTLNIDEDGSEIKETHFEIYGSIEDIPDGIKGNAWGGIDWNPDQSDMISMTELIVKKLNKAKSIFESLK